MRDLLFPKAADWHLLILSWWMAFSELADVLGMHQFQRISVILPFCLQIPLFLLCWCRRFMKRLVTVEGNRFFHVFERSFGLLVVTLSLVEFSNHVCFVGATLAVPCNRKWLTCLRIVWSQISPPLHPLGWITLVRLSWNGAGVWWKGMGSFLHVSLRGQFILKWQHLWTQMHSSMPYVGLLHVADKSESCDLIMARIWLVENENSERLYRIGTLTELRLFFSRRILLGFSTPLGHLIMVVLGNAWSAVLAGSW